VALNKWECEHPGCTSTAVGVGGAAGLQAIGWWFLPGPNLRCPAHRPNPIPCREDGDNHGKPCGQCAAEEDADLIQNAIVHHREDMRAWWAAQKLVESKSD
jgi:hypothetical protein